MSKENPNIERINGEEEEGEKTGSGAVEKSPVEKWSIRSMVEEERKKEAESKLGLDPRYDYPEVERVIDGFLVFSSGDTYKSTIADMESQGYRPANKEELLSFLKFHRVADLDITVVGQVKDLGITEYINFNGGLSYFNEVRHFFPVDRNTFYLMFVPN